MVMERFPMTEGELTIDAPEPRWAQLVLSVDDRLHRLGADSLDYLIRGLQRVVENSGGAVEGFDGEDMRWAMSLSEVHCAIYTAQVGDDVAVFIQDANAHLIHRDTLTPSARMSWRRDLFRLAAETGKRV